MKKLFIRLLAICLLVMSPVVALVACFFRESYLECLKELSAEARKLIRVGGL